MNDKNSALINVEHLVKHFPVKGKGLLHAVDNVSFSIKPGETLGLVGESGCGKSTVGNLLMGLLKPTSGKITFNGDDITNLDRAERKAYCSRMQIVFQDPYSSLNPKKMVRDILAEAYLIHKTGNRAEIERRIRELCMLTGIEEELWVKYPHELDGGKRQVVGIARALALGPKFIVCDEPVSALDVSIQAKIINLLIDLQQKLNLTYLFISHDLSVIRHISQRVAVMYLGKIVEIAPVDKIFEDPRHPYTMALLSAVLTVDPTARRDHIVLEGDVPTPIDPKPGCRFGPRCRFATEKCFQSCPSLVEAGDGHFVACYL